MTEPYSIEDLFETADVLRKTVALTFSKEPTEDLDEYITLHQIVFLIMDHAVGADSEGQFMMDKTNYNILLQVIHEWMYNTGLAKIASSGRLACAWDDDLNTMIFWIPEGVEK